MKTFSDALRQLIREKGNATDAMRAVWKEVKAGRVARPARKGAKRARHVAIKKKAKRIARRALKKAARKMKAAPAPRARRNPAGHVQSEVQQAIQRYTGFKGEAPKHLDQVRLPPPPRVLLTMGECIGIMYRTKRDGVVDQFLHRFRPKSRPTLAVSSDGKNLYLLGGAYRVTDRGIEDA